MSVVQEPVWGHHTSAQPMATTPGWQTSVEPPCYRSQVSGHAGERHRPLLLKAISGQTACSYIFQVLCMLCSCLVVSWAVPFFLSPLKPKPPFLMWSVPSNVNWQVV